MHRPSGPLRAVAQKPYENMMRPVRWTGDTWVVPEATTFPAPEALGSWVPEAIGQLSTWGEDTWDKRPSSDASLPSPWRSGLYSAGARPVFCSLRVGRRRVSPRPCRTHRGPPSRRLEQGSRRRLQGPSRGRPRRLLTARGGGCSSWSAWIGRDCAHPGCGAGGGREVALSLHKERLGAACKTPRIKF